ncbi:unnamed protein product [Medioppia subpectinata]|uniref:Transcription elongation factor 1 homolog n=1 Tax=Medioppia subpectinata TaxID=1979941 RepID=A0A7R9KVW5_9ACAR|nr:unnamed protein product [Medioppia subpectinata]CAD7630404.1 unnamed protein product [Medioppia subpectinata]CAG2107738.1 unnamed protein product [Medioppia subpectinata]CAG2110834.1 unnamed protein product [Medioppia subpectinata]
MAKRKSQRKPIVRKLIEPFATEFDCPYCGRAKSCHVNLDRSCNTGRIECQKCFIWFQMTTTYLTAPIDVYMEWMDAFEESEGYLE